MSRRLVAICLLTLAFLHIIAFVIDARADHSAIVVPDDFPTLQEAINAANNADTIHVRNGFFYGAIVVNKTLTIMGESRTGTMIDCNETSSCTVTVTANNSILRDFTVQNGSFGFMLENVSGVTIKNIDIKDSRYGVSIRSSSNNSIYGCHLIFSSGRGLQAGFEIILNSSSNTITENDITPGTLFSQTGIVLGEASYNVISGNNVYGHEYGMHILSDSHDNIICGNNIASNDYGIYMFGTNDKLYHNNFVGNRVHVYGLLENSTWDDGYPSGGNFWSVDADGMHYSTTFDEYCGPSQNLPGSDGIGDFPAWLGIPDSFPLMGMFSDFNTTSGQHIQTICNSTITDFRFDGTAIGLTVSGQNGTVGFCRICIPTALMADNYTLFFDGTQVDPAVLPCSDSNNSYLYFSYNLPIKETLRYRADLNKDGIIDLTDFKIVAELWLSTSENIEWKPEADLNDDGVINVLDMCIVLTMLGESPNMIKVTIISEFPSFLILPLFMIATLFAVIIYRKKSTR